MRYSDRTSTRCVYLMCCNTWVVDADHVPHECEGEVPSMSAITAAQLDRLRLATLVRDNDTVRTYQADLLKAPRLVVIGHLLLVACRMVALTARVARHGVADSARTIARGR